MILDALFEFGRDIYTIFLEGISIAIIGFAIEKLISKKIADSNFSKLLIKGEEHKFSKILNFWIDNEITLVKHNPPNSKVKVHRVLFIREDELEKVKKIVLDSIQDADNISYSFHFISENNKEKVLSLYLDSIKAEAKKLSPKEKDLVENALNQPSIEGKVNYVNRLFELTKGDEKLEVVLNS